MHFSAKASVAALLVLSAFGCSSEESDAEKDPLSDPTSRESLRPAKTLDRCCKYIEEESYSYMDKPTVRKTPQCKPGRCVDLPSPPSSFGMSDGYGNSMSSYTSYTGQEDFLGTCESPKPITCEGRPVADACDRCVAQRSCSALVQCENDPNCLALAQCFDHCDADEACATRCAENADRVAKGNLEIIVTVMTNSCSADCL